MVQQYELALQHEQTSYDEYDYYTERIEQLKAQITELQAKAAQAPTREFPVAIFSEFEVYTIKKSFSDLKTKCRATTTGNVYLEINSSLKEIVERYVQIKKIGSTSADKSQVIDRSIRLMAMIQGVNELFSKYPKFD